jgi:acetyl-CoA carboxylase biotin carboxyl carrier protein
MQIEKIEAIIEVLENSKTKEITVEKDGCKIKIVRGAAKPAPKVKSKQTIKVPETVNVVDNASYIKSGRVGILHLSENAVIVGDKVHKGQIIGAIESMKVFNDVVADSEGTVTEVFVEDGTPVEFGQRLFRVE